MSEIIKKKTNLEAVNWNKINDRFSKVFWDQNVRQFWVDEEIPLSGDKLTWRTKLNPKEQEVFTKVLAGLTLLDTYQGAIGMNKLCLHIDNLHTKAILQFMGMMEQMHAKSYSSIFSTLVSTEEINKLFEWAKNNETLQKKLNLIISYYENINDSETLYMAMVASVFLESFLFYSGFFYVLYLSGQGLMINSCEIINLIIRDEAIHGLYIGLLSHELFLTFDKETQAKLKQQTIQLLEKLMEMEKEYTSLLYSQISLTDSVNKFIEYNANKALQNLSFEPYYSTTEKDINPIVFNGLKVTTKNHDFFTTKGNGYIKTTKVEDIEDEDFF